MITNAVPNRRGTKQFGFNTARVEELRHSDPWPRIVGRANHEVNWKRPSASRGHLATSAKNRTMRLTNEKPGPHVFVVRRGIQRVNRDTLSPCGRDKRVKHHATVAWPRDAQPTDFRTFSLQRRIGPVSELIQLNDASN